MVSGGSEVVSAHGTDDGAQISGGKQLVYGSASGATVFTGSQVVELGGTANNTTVSSGGTEIVLSGGTDIGATILTGGTAIVSSGGIFELTSGTTGLPNLLAGATLEVGSGAVFSSVVSSGVGVEVLSGGTYSGTIGNGIVLVAPGGTADVTFLSTGTGGLEIEDTHANPTAYSGVVSGFGGVGHSNHTQFIDLGRVAYSAGETATYSANGSNTGGVLTVSSGGTAVAEITLVGTYKTSNFHISSGIGDSVKITDPSAEQQPGNAPATIAGGTVLEINTADSGKVTFSGTGGMLLLDQPSVFTGAISGFAAGDALDLTDIAFGADTTLGYSVNATGTGGTLSVSDGMHNASITLFGQYAAVGFQVGSDHGGGAIITYAAPGASVSDQTLVTNPGQKR